MPTPSHPPQATRPRVAIIGGGITGLAAGQALLDAQPTCQLTIFEAANRVGGVLETVQQGDFLIERSADSFITREPWPVDLCQRLGLGDELINTQSTSRRALVVSGGKIHPVPPGFVLMAPERIAAVMKTSVLSPFGKLRLACEPFIRARPANPQHDGQQDESVASFARRRLGREVFERLVQPLVAGIWTANPERLSMAATLPQFLDDEREHGSLWRAARRRSDSTGQSTGSGARYGLFVAPRRGMSSLIEALGNWLPANTIRLSARVSQVVAARDGSWTVELAGAAQHESFDAVIVATSARVAAEITRAVDQELSQQLGQIAHASSTIVSLGYRRDQIRHPLDGFGMVVPHAEGRRIIAASFSSVKFAGRAADDQVLIRTFVGGALQPDFADLPDDQVQELAEQELDSLLGVTGRPLVVDIARWPHSMPQYHLGHLDRVSRIERLTSSHAGLELAGNAYHGVGVPQCIHSGQQAAARVLATL